MPHPRSLSSWEGKKKKNYFCILFAVFWRQVWKAQKSSGRGATCGMRAKFSAAMVMLWLLQGCSLCSKHLQIFFLGLQDTFLIPKLCALLISPALTKWIPEEPWKSVLPIALAASGLIPIQHRDAGCASPGPNLNSAPASINKSLGNATMVWMDLPQHPALCRDKTPTL